MTDAPAPRTAPGLHPLRMPLPPMPEQGTSQGVTELPLRSRLSFLDRIAAVLAGVFVVAATSGAMVRFGIGEGLMVLAGATLVVILLLLQPWWRE